ncbi:ribosome maturation factor RimM [bacterium]|jgi:16S rRNA processing protein RimM|nr:ribosome maturation factor RimM [Porticoccaceae bacterium]MDC3261658.1 ribosome maturation factor RimM [bacterium]
METLVVGRITAVFGVRGWVKVFSYTEQLEALFDYQPWLVDTDAGRQELTVDDWKRHGDGLVVHFKGLDDRDIARDWCQRDILVDKSRLPSLSQAEFYWHQLVGLAVVSHFEGTELRFGVVKSLLETGANDVLVVEGDADSIDRDERLIPYAEQFVTKVDLDAQRIDVIWDPEF